MWPFSGRRSLERSIGRSILAELGYSGAETGLLRALFRSEARASLENPSVKLSDAAAWAAVFGSFDSAAGVDVTPEKALSVPAVWAAVNFISGTFAALPSPVYRRTADGRERDERNQVAILLHDWVNDDYLTSFAWRKHSMVNTLLRGRSYTFIERKKDGQVRNLWPLDPTRVVVDRVDGRRRYRYTDPANRQFAYDVAEIIDVPFLMACDNLRSHDPVATLRNAIGLAIALEEYASRFFQNGGVPPLSLQMPSGTSPAAANRAVANIDTLLKTRTDDKRNVMPMPGGHRLEPIGFKPQEGQLIEARLMQLREIARIYQLPPVFLQDLQFGTYSNTEQQDLILVKHTLTQWLRAWEQELNAKLFGPRSTTFIEFNVDGLLRGDFATRMDGYAKGIQNGIVTPDEIRDLENRPRHGGAAGQLFIQGATVPLGSQPGAKPPAT